MGVEVRCTCGEVAVAEEAHRGQFVQCPGCGLGVPVPVATARRREPTDEERRAEQEERHAATERRQSDRQAEAVAELLLGLGLAAVGVFFLWDMGLGKLFLMGGLLTAADASRKF